VASIRADIARAVRIQEPATMSPRQISLVRESFARVEPIADLAATIFYDRLFALDPAVRRLFVATDMPTQRRNLMQTLAVVVANLDRIEGVVPAVEALGRRHVGYGVEPGDFETVGAALLDTLELGLKPDFTAETRAAWAAAYHLLATVMISAGEPVSAGNSAAEPAQTAA
jgi:hemoglobin-like flavoprotein